LKLNAVEQYRKHFSDILTHCRSFARAYRADASVSPKQLTGAFVRLRSEKRTAMARVISEKIWHSTKVSNIQPKEWRSEYAWLVAIAYVDGTFEADARDVWARAYAYSRPDWSAEKVAQLLDEFEHVGLLQRAKDEDGRVWGYWTGSDKFTPPPSKWKHYRSGKLDLFTAGVHKVNTDAAQSVAQVHTEGELCAGSTCIDVGSSTRTCSCIGTCVCKASKSSETALQQQPQKQEREREAFTSKPNTADATATPTPKSERKRPVLSEHDFGRQKVADAAAEFAAELAARSACSKCGIKHEGECKGEPFKKEK
jgi:hypothetical protein